MTSCASSSASLPRPSAPPSNASASSTWPSPGSQILRRCRPRPGGRDGIAAFSVASLLGGLATSPAWLVSCRAIQGFAAAFAAPGSLSLIATNFTEGEQRNRAPLNMLALSGIERKDAGAASGVLQTMQRFGSAVGLAVLVTAFGTAERDTRPQPGLSASARTHDVLAHGIASAFTVGWFFTVAGLLITAFVIKSKKAAA